MTKRSFALLALLPLTACSKQEQAGDPDSVLVTKYNEPQPVAHPAVADSLPVDSVAIRRAQDEQKLARFDPKQVVAMYESYQPLRKPQTSAAQIDAFLREHKMTRDELRALLATGDRLGWAK